MQLEQLGKALSEHYEVREFTYGQEVSEGISLSQLEGLTDIGQALREVYDRLSGPDLGAVIIDGDGIFNRGRDPRIDATRLGVPVYTVALGDTTVRPDLVLRGVDNNRISYLGNEFPVLVRIEGRHLKGKQTRVAILQNGKEVAGKDVAITADPFTVEVPFTLKADKPGLQRFTAVVRTLNEEITEVNNSRGFLVDVLDDRQKILLLLSLIHI